MATYTNSKTQPVKTNTGLVQALTPQQPAGGGHFQGVGSPIPAETPPPMGGMFGGGNQSNGSGDQVVPPNPAQQANNGISGIYGGGENNTIGAEQPPNMPSTGATNTPAQSPNPYANNPYAPDQATGIGSVSAVNPQAGQVDYSTLNSNFIDPAYQQAMNRLNPQFDAQTAAFDQNMANRGIGVGSDAYNKARTSMNQNQNDARSSANFDAMQFGMGAQNQMFGQDATRSSLANSLLQTKMGLNEQGRQFDDNSNYKWDRAQQNDLGWLANFDRQGQQYNDQQDWNYFNANQGLLGAIPGWNPAQIDVNGSAGAATNSQNAAFNAQNQLGQQAWSQITDVMGMGAMAMGSDRRLKDNITKIGEIDGQNIYRWTWNKIAKRLGIGQQPTIGVIAQETPAEFVSVRDGYLAVNYEGLLNAIT